MNPAAFLACMAPPWVHMLSYWIPVSALGVALALGVACFVIELRRRRFRWLVVYAALLALQPGWGLVSQELRTGLIRVRADCGYGQRSLSLFLLAAAVAVAVVAWRRPATRRRTFIFGLVVAFTFMNVLGELLLYSTLPPAIPHELYASIFTGFGGPPLLLLLCILACAVLYVVQRFSRTAV